MEYDKHESIERKAARGGLWLAGFRYSTQLCSWVITIIIARILVPADYGLFEMATILTGYVAIFSELGLGAAIVQRERINNKELSSLFWLLVFWGFILALICFILAYPAVAIFGEKRILRITQAVSLVFIISSLSIVPRNLLQRDLRFKTIGLIDASSVLPSSLIMIIIAKSGGGIWTLISGMIIQEFLRAFLLFVFAGWSPQIHFRITEIKAYVKFGLNLAGANSLGYIFEKADRFFGGRALGASALGNYSLAIQLSVIPTAKLVSLINSVSFPVFSRYQRHDDNFNSFYLRLVKIISFITMPVYVGGFFIADELIPFVLGSKWLAVIFPFKLLCLSQIITSITTPTPYANVAQGRPHWLLYMSIICLFIVPLSFYIASRHGLNALAIPWITVIPVLKLSFTWVTIRELGIPTIKYCQSLVHAFLATTCMISVLFFVKQICFNSGPFLTLLPGIYLIISILVVSLSYGAYCLAFQRSFLTSCLNLFRST